MVKQKAADYFHGEEGYNCAQSVVKAFEERFKLNPEAVKNFKALGGGRAEGGLCGALFAAQSLCEDEGKKSIIEERFTEAAGSNKCREIRKLNAFSCRECVYKAAELLDDITK